ncbi:MAG: helix-turn-helix transcriptional regulator [Planctomycetes bacterium]|nr:helix-turn-helix transcriptional regulator [Planctomycetota bacterium]
MEKSAFSPLYKALRERLVAMRTAAKLTQRQLADKLQRERSFVSRIELGERRLDVLEFYWVCKACDQNPRQVLGELVDEFERMEGRSTSPKSKRRR